MKNSVVVFLSVVLLVACGKNDRQSEVEQMNAYKEEIVELERKVADLEEKLKQDRVEQVRRVRTEILKGQVFENHIQASGIVEADENIIVSPETGGKIVSLAVKEGDRVKRGTVLARLNTAPTEQALAQVQINLDLAVTTYERQADLWKQQIGSEMEYLRAKSSMQALEKQKESLLAQLELAVIRAPIDGVVDELLQKQGEMAGPQIPFARLLNIDKVYVTADISEQYLTQVKAGDEIKINFPVLNKQFESKVFRTSSIIDPQSRTFRVRVNLSNASNELKPNMLSVMTLRTYIKKDAVVIPSLLVRKDFKGEFVFVAVKKDGQWRAEKRYVISGMKNNNEVLVEEGLHIGDQIITAGYAQVVDGMAIAIE